MKVSTTLKKLNSKFKKVVIYGAHKWVSASQDEKHAAFCNQSYFTAFVFDW